jgi:hypothetical protein
MKEQNKNIVHISDRMVLTALGLGIGYWLIETVLYIFLSYQINFMERLFGPDLAGISARLIVICLFLIFGSHAQVTINERRHLELELNELKQKNEMLEKELNQRNNRR